MMKLERYEYMICPRRSDLH